jgi:hypothetical protein
VDPETIRGWIARAEADAKELAEQAEAIQAQLAEARRRLMLFYEMLAAATNSPVPVSSEEMGLARSTRNRVWDHAEQILVAHGRPMRIQDIHTQFVRSGYPLPGRGTPTNIVAHLVAAPERFSRPSRGVYGVAEWDRPSHPASAEPSTAPAPTEAIDPERAQPLTERLARTS